MMKHMKRANGKRNRKAKSINEIFKQIEDYDVQVEVVFFPDKKTYEKFKRDIKRWQKYQ